MQRRPSPILLILILSCFSLCGGFFIHRTSVADTHRIRHTRAIYAAIDDVSGDEGQQRGMDEAFASLDALSPSDWNVDGDTGDKNDLEDDGYRAELSYSRTDDTDAADTGKSTREEVEYYLEMSTELDGTSTMQEEEEEEFDEEADIKTELEYIDDEEADILENASESDVDYPWESINPILRLRGPVATGYGRGGKKLGVPTANLPASLFQSALETVDTGVYFGWAVIEQSSEAVQKQQGRNGPIKAVVNVGYSPTFEGKENKEKIVEAHLITNQSPREQIDEGSISTDIVLEQDGESDIIDEIEGDFYNETMRLQLIGFLRPEQKFESFPELIAQIHRDIGTADFALKSMPYIFSKEDVFIQDGTKWIGSGGGDDVASWEFETW